MSHTYRVSPHRWPLERVLFAPAGSVTLLTQPPSVMADSTARSVKCAWAGRQP
jgi:hypothetical protein